MTKRFNFKLAFFSIVSSILFCFSAFAANVEKKGIDTSKIKDTAEKAGSVVSETASKMFSSNANFLGESIIPGLLNGQVLFYFIIPLAIFAVLLIIINNIVLRKNVDTQMIIIGLAIIIALQFFIKTPLNNAIQSTRTIAEGLTGAITGFFAKLFGGDSLKDMTEWISLVKAIAIDVVLAFVGVLCHNLFIDHREADKSQGVKVVVAQLLAACGIICLFAFNIIGAI